jgi:hypothetical protein
MDIVLRGKAGPPSVHREGSTVVVKKTLSKATVEERSTARRLRGKTSMTQAASAQKLKSALSSVRAAADIEVASTRAGAEAKNTEVRNAMAGLAHQLDRRLTAAHKKEINELGFKELALR